jgi:predicted RNase H-like HicB family nuclease
VGDQRRIGHITRFYAVAAAIIPVGEPQDRWKQSRRKSIPIVLGQEDDGRRWADIESMPGVMADGPTREAAISAVRALALRVAADCIDHGAEVPPQFEKVFSVA